MEKPVLFHPVALQGLPSLQAWLPNLLRREVELSLEKLDLIWDHSYAWDMFLDMMVGGLCARPATFTVAMGYLFFLYEHLCFLSM